MPEPRRCLVQVLAADSTGAAPAAPLPLWADGAARVGRLLDAAASALGVVNENAKAAPDSEARLHIGPVRLEGRAPAVAAADTAVALRDAVPPGGGDGDVWVLWRGHTPPPLALP